MCPRRISEAQSPRPRPASSPQFTGRTAAGEGSPRLRRPGIDPSVRVPALLRHIGGLSGAPSKAPAAARGEANAQAQTALVGHRSQASRCSRSALRQQLRHWQPPGSTTRSPLATRTPRARPKPGATSAMAAHRATSMPMVATCDSRTLAAARSASRRSRLSIPTRKATRTSSRSRRVPSRGGARSPAVTTTAARRPPRSPRSIPRPASRPLRTLADRIPAR